MKKSKFGLGRCSVYERQELVQPIRDKVYKKPFRICQLKESGSDPGQREFSWCDLLQSGMDKTSDIIKNWEFNNIFCILLEINQSQITKNEIDENIILYITFNDVDPATVSSKNGLSQQCPRSWPMYRK